MAQEFGAIENDCGYYKEKYDEMQDLVENCRLQMKEFDSVNDVSQAVIIKLQSDLA